MKVSEVKDFLRMCKCGDFIVTRYERTKIPFISIFKEYDDETSTLYVYADAWLDILCECEKPNTILIDLRRGECRTIMKKSPTDKTIIWLIIKQILSARCIFTRHEKLFSLKREKCGHI